MAIATTNIARGWGNGFDYDPFYDINMTKKFLPQNQPTNVVSGAHTGATYMTNDVDLTGGSLAPYVRVPAYVPPNPNALPQSYYTQDTMDTKSMVFKLLNSPYDFHLGGSRAMYKRGAAVVINENTDYDFYITDSQHVRMFLDVIGFRSATTKLEYLDTEAEFIMKYDKIDVVLRKDAKFYRSIFENIPVDLYVKHLWKGNPDCDRKKIQPLFNEMFKIAHAKEQSNLTVPSMETAYIDYPINDVVTPPQTATQIRQTAFRQEIGIGDDDY